MNGGIERWDSAMEDARTRIGTDRRTIKTHRKEKENRGDRGAACKTVQDIIIGNIITATFRALGRVIPYHTIPVPIPA
jgi:hypothetical protein